MMRLQKSVEVWNRVRPRSSLSIPPLVERIRDVVQEVVRCRRLLSKASRAFAVLSLLSPIGARLLAQSKGANERVTRPAFQHARAAR